MHLSSGVRIPFFAAEDLTVVKLYSVGTVAAGTWDFLTKEHGDSSFVNLLLQIIRSFF
jgi:hypothetical protein